MQMEAVKVIGFDIAKSVFQVHGINAEGKVILRRQLKRRHILPFFQRPPSCLVGIEACASSRYWSRELLQRFVGRHLRCPQNSQQAPRQHRGLGRPHRFHATERRDKEPAGSTAPLLSSDRAQSLTAIPVVCRSSRERQCLFRLGCRPDV
jgi:hypothetical protein